MKLTACTTIICLLMYIWIVIRVGNARRVHKIDAPNIIGPIEFMAALRVQANTVEQMILFLPLLWLCAAYLSDMIAAILGLIWIIGRLIYALGYYRAPQKRHLGFGVATLAAFGLLIGSITGLILN